MFEILSIIPFIVFGAVFFVIFGIFINGALNLLFSKDSKRGIEIVIKSLIYFIIFLVVFLIFVIVSLMVERGAIFQPRDSDTEFPLSPVGKFPPAPKFFEILGYGFSQPQILSEEAQPSGSIVFAMLCKKETDYDIIDIGIISEFMPILNHPNYSCWVESCGLQNIYISFYRSERGSEISDKEKVDMFNKSINPVCQRQ